MTRRTGEDVLTREEADRRIRGTARVASALCWVAATLALALAALLCGRVRRTGEVFSPRRARELGAVGWLLLLAGVLPPLVLNVAWPVVTGLTRSLGLSYSMSLPVMREDFVLCAAGLLLVAVARMFEYGCILQKQDDELL